jgi:arylsulfatase A-like enzyme
MQSPAGAIRVGDDKLIEYFENGTVQLFDLQADPGEQRDLAALRRDRVAVLRERLHRWRSEVGAQMPGANPEYRETAEIR